MKWVKVASISLGLVLVGLAFLVIFGVPARILATSLSRQFEASSGLRLQIAGFVKLALWPQLGLVVEDVSVEDVGTSEQLFATKRVRYGIALMSLIKGQIRVTEVALTRPTLRFARRSPGVVRESGPARPAEVGPARGESLLRTFALEQLTAEDCTLVVDDGRDKTEVHIDAVRLDTSVSPSNDRLTLRLDARSGTNTVLMKATAESPALLLDGKPVRVEAAVEATGALQSPATIAANLQVSGPLVRLDGLDGRFDRGRVGGSISVSFARTKPFLDATIDLERLDLTDVAPAATNARPGAAGDEGGNRAPGRASRWSDRPVSLAALRLFEANAKIGAREIVIGKVRLGPANLEVTLLDDTLTVVLPRAELYGGQGSGQLVADASKAVPTLSMQFDLAGLNVLPILSDAADFQYVEGRGGAKIDVKGSGESPLRVVSSLEGTAEFKFENGALRGISVPRMLQSVLETILSGWQTNASDQTKFSTFGASFRVKDGQARTDDLRFAGPFVRVAGSGTVDLIEQTLDFRLDPKLVGSPAGQGGGAESWNVGVQVIARGPWSKPQIYADLPGILSNPQAALEKLKPLEKNLLGPSANRPDSWLKTLDDLIGGARGIDPGDSARQPPSRQ
ncbi:MAG TPA: AsmA family protein [Xanthobacteraceae bacterium]|nr:AsmA family protein [Xanthobacteraceae bacterium]